MKFDDTSGPLRDLAKKLRATIVELSGIPPTYRSNDGFYQARSISKNRAFLYFYIAGPRARKFPVNSIRLLTGWQESLENIGATKGNNWFGGVSAEYVVEPHDNVVTVSQAQDFIKIAHNHLG